MLLLTQGINLLAVDNGVTVKKKREETSFLLISFFEKERREHFDDYIIFFIELKHEKFPAVWTAAKHVSFVTMRCLSSAFWHCVTLETADEQVQAE